MDRIGLLAAHSSEQARGFMDRTGSMATSTTVSILITATMDRCRSVASRLSPTSTQTRRGTDKVTSAQLIMMAAENTLADSRAVVAALVVAGGRGNPNW